MASPEGVDFYIGRPLAGHEPPRYLGSATLGHDMPALAELLEVVQHTAVEPATDQGFEEWVAGDFSLHPRWPWRWLTSTDTPWSVCYASRSLYVHRYGRLYVVAHLSRWEPGADPAPFPMMRGST